MYLWSTFVQSHNVGPSDQSENGGSIGDKSSVAVLSGKSNQNWCRYLDISLVKFLTSWFFLRFNPVGLEVAANRELEVHNYFLKNPKF